MGHVSSGIVDTCIPSNTVVKAALVFLVHMTLSLSDHREEPILSGEQGKPSQSRKRTKATFLYGIKKVAFVCLAERKPSS